MCERESLAVGFLLVSLQPLVEIQRIRCSERRLRRQGHDLLGAHGTVDQGREPPGLVVLLGGVDDPVPDVVGNPGAGRVVLEDLLWELHLREMRDQVESGLARRLAAFLETLVPFPALRHREDVRRPFLDVCRQAHRIGMVRDRHPVERPSELHRQAGRRLDLLATCEAVGVFRAEDIAEQTGIERQPGVQVCFTPEDPAREVTLRIGRERLARVDPLEDLEIRVSNVLGGK